MRVLPKLLVMVLAALAVVFVAQSVMACDGAACAHTQVAKTADGGSCSATAKSSNGQDIFAFVAAHGDGSGQCPFAAAAHGQTIAVGTHGEGHGGGHGEGHGGGHGLAAVSVAHGDGNGQCPFSADGQFGGEGCPIEAAMARLPQITFKVGTDKTQCSATAQKLADSSKHSLQYVVAGKSYESEGDANLALVEATEQFVTTFVSVGATCEVSGQTEAVGKTYACATSAGEAIAIAKAAMDKLMMTYQVGAEATQCSVTAAELAKTSGTPMLYVVGEQKTNCAVTARLNLARARYLAAVQALAQVEQATEPQTEEQAEADAPGADDA